MPRKQLSRPRSLRDLLVLLSLVALVSVYQLHNNIRSFPSQVKPCETTRERKSVRPATAVLISGQCDRFIYRDQPGSYFTSEIPFSVYIALHCGEEVHSFIKNRNDAPQSPPYMETVQVRDIKDWFLHEKGAQSVEITILDDEQMAEAVDTIKKQTTSIRGNGGYLYDVENNMAEILDSDPFFDRWAVEFRKFYLRHVVYQMAYPYGHREFLYHRDDNFFLNPLPMDVIQKSLQQGENTSMPVVFIDEPCDFGSYSDKLYVSNALGSDLLYGSQMAEFVEKMKRYVLFGFYRRPFTRQPFQPEAFVHDSFSGANVVLFNMERVDVRYNHDGERCVPKLYHDCMPERTQSLVQDRGLDVCKV